VLACRFTGHYDTVSVTVADERLEILWQDLSDFFDLLNTPDKREALRSIIEALRRGEVPLR
jgi:hypothetical protein